MLRDDLAFGWDVHRIHTQIAALLDDRSHHDMYSKGGEQRPVNELQLANDHGK